MTLFTVTGALSEQCLSNPNYQLRKQLGLNFIILSLFVFVYPNTETANRHVAAIFRNYNEIMKSIRQHCGSHFSYLVTGLTDRVQVDVITKEQNRQYKSTLLVKSFNIIFIDVHLS